MTARSTTRRMIIEKIGHLCDYILFDEAWAGFMKFHPIYAGRFAMGLDDLGRGRPGIIATQSTHKQLASFSQASQIHVKDSHIKRPAPARRASPLQRVLHAARLDLAVLSAVRLARRRRADDEGPLGRGVVGRHHPARHRAAQEAARGPRASSSTTETGSGTPLVLRSLRARSRRRSRPRWRAGARDRVGRGRRRTISPPSPRFWELAPGAAGTASATWRRATRSPIPTS